MTVLSKLNLSQKIQSASAHTRRVVRNLLIIGGLVTAIAVGSVSYAITTLVPHAHAIYSVAKLIDGEARGESRKGQKAVFASIVYRVEDNRFPDTIHGVAYQPYNTTDKVLQYNAMGDHLHEDLSTELGQTILIRSAWWYTQYQWGIFSAPKEAQGAHSYCVQAACDRQSAYFGTLKVIGSIGNHVFYGDCDCVNEEPVADNVLTSSLRPKLRPQSSSQGSEQYLDERIEAVLVELLTD